MREIKFRGWDGHNMHPPEDLTQSPTHREWLGKVDFELMQYAGTKDKNGVEIYEGDILERKYDYYFSLNKFEFARGVVTYSPSNGFSLTKVMVKFNGSDKWVKSRPINSLHDFKVIGNIHENPEILEQTE
jgi:uncharacterized phage protein (TIGR01671 family)